MRFSGWRYHPKSLVPGQVHKLILDESNKSSKKQAAAGFLVNMMPWENQHQTYQPHRTTSPFLKLLE